MDFIDEGGIVGQVAEPNIGEQQVEEASGPPSLLKVLSISLISDVFIKHIGIPERRSLRQTCRLSRNLLKCHPLRIQRFEIAMIRYNDTRDVRETGIVFKSDSEERSLRRENIEGDPNLRRFMRRDLKSMVLNKETEIEELCIRRLSIRATLFITDLRLNVVKFHIIVDRENEIRDGLTILNPRSIQEIWIDTAEIRTYDRIVPSADDFAHWKLQWKMAKLLVCKMVFQTKGFLNNFSHFDYAHIVVENTRISLGVLEDLKNTLLLRPTVQKFEIVPTRHHYALDPLFIIPPRSFRPFQDPTNPAKFIFPYPDSQEVLTFEMSYNGIFFKGPAYSGDKDVRKEVPRERIMEELVETEAMYNELPYYCDRRD